MLRLSHAQAQIAHVVQDVQPWCTQIPNSNCDQDAQALRLPKRLGAHT